MFTAYFLCFKLLAQVASRPLAYCHKVIINQSITELNFLKYLNQLFKQYFSRILDSLKVADMYTWPVIALQVAIKLLADKIVTHNLKD